MRRPVLGTSGMLIVGLLLAGVASPLLAASGSSQPAPPPGAPAAPPKTPEQLAVEDYNFALGHRDKAWKLEEKAAAAEGAQRDKLARKVEKQYEKAIGLLERAVSRRDRFHEAWSSLGYAYRKVGRYDDALEAYDRSLALAPRYAEAIEYRAEAYLALDRLDDAKAAYSTLQQFDRQRAQELLAAMSTWVQVRRREPNDLPRERVEGFATWVSQQGDRMASSGGW